MPGARRTGDAAAALLPRRARAKRIEKELSKLYKQQAEFNAFNEKLLHYADQRISLNLEDGMKVNYGNLLTEVKQVVGIK